jgi:hypothetical protein
MIWFNKNADARLRRRIVVDAATCPSAAASQPDFESGAGKLAGQDSSS